MEERQQLLDGLYRVWWEESATLESDRPGYAYISYEDIGRLDHVCEQIEAIDNAAD